MILPALFAIPVTPLYLLTDNYAMIVVFFALQGCFGAGGIYGQNASYMTERFPTEVRATASGFCYHQGAIFGGLVGPIHRICRPHVALGFCHPDAHRHLGRPRQLHPRPTARPGDQGKQMVADLTLA